MRIIVNKIKKFFSINSNVTKKEHKRHGNWKKTYG